MRTKTHKINNEAKSYLAKLLATENISVEHRKVKTASFDVKNRVCLLYTSPSPRDVEESRMPSSA